MFAKHSFASYGGRHRHHAHGRGYGAWGRPRRGGFLPFLAGVLLARAAMRGSHRRRGRGPWGWEEWRSPHDYGGWGGGPWGRGRWGRGRDYDQARAAFGALRSEIGPLVLLLRDAFRRGALDGRKIDEIRAVFADARRRIAAILGETQSGPTEL